MAKMGGNDRTPMFGSPDVYVKNQEKKSTQPKFDAYRKASQAGFVRHPPKTTKTVSKGCVVDDNNAVGAANLRAQCAIANEQGPEDVDGM